MGFEVRGTLGALAWDFQRMNELRLYRTPAAGEDGGGYATVFASPDDGAFARFQPDTAIPMGYDDLKVIEARRFLQAVADGVSRPPNARSAAAVAEVLNAMLRSAASRATEQVTPAGG
jgi:predicted dehydrogenase